MTWNHLCHVNQNPLKSPHYWFHPDKTINFVLIRLDAFKKKKQVGLFVGEKPFAFQKGKCQGLVMCPYDDFQTSFDDVIRTDTDEFCVRKGSGKAPKPM